MPDPLDRPATPEDDPGTDPPAGAPAPGQEPPPLEPGAVPTIGHRPSGSVTPPVPLYKGEPLDAERGPGLGWFWTQVVLLAILLVLTPLTVVWAWDPTISAALLIATLMLLLFAGQTVIFLLRLVAADRRTRRRPLGEGARKTVGQMEDEAGSPKPPEDEQRP